MYEVPATPAANVYVATPEALVIPVPSVAAPFRKLTVSPATAGVTVADSVTVEPETAVDLPRGANVVVVVIALTVSVCDVLADAA